jgi:predicted DNA-binding mobile mystery protein A
MNAKELRLDQLDAVLLGAASHPLPPRPPVGWLRAIRETLGMTSVALGQRLRITASGVRKLEQAEAADAITLATLRRVAEALDCELHYALVPRQPHERAGRTMALEAQPVDAPSTSPRERLETMAQEILRSSGTRLWD